VLEAQWEGTVRVWTVQGELPGWLGLRGGHEALAAAAAASVARWVRRVDCKVRHVHRQPIVLPAGGWLLPADRATARCHLPATAQARRVRRHGRVDLPRQLDLLDAVAVAAPTSASDCAPAGWPPAGRGGGGSLAPAAASALGAWAGLSPADQWLLVIIFALCGLIGLLLYAWCSGRAARASTARRGRQQMLDSDKGGAPSGPSVPASSLPRAASSQPEHEAGPSSDDEASPVPTADGIAVNIEMRPQCSRVVP